MKLLNLSCVRIRALFYPSWKQIRIFWTLKVDGNEKRGGGVRKETVIQILYGIVAIGGYFKFERAVSL
jgi:hypothetical protein